MWLRHRLTLHRQSVLRPQGIRWCCQVSAEGILDYEAELEPIEDLPGRAPTGAIDRNQRARLTYRRRIGNSGLLRSRRTRRWTISGASRTAIARLKAEGRYRTFANLERDARRFPIAQWRPEGEEDRPREVTVWCSNDYLSMGGHPDVIEASVKAVCAHGAGRVEPVTFPAPTTRSSSSRPSSPTCMASPRRSSSPPAGCPIWRRFRPSPACCPIA